MHTQPSTAFKGPAAKRAQVKTMGPAISGMHYGLHRPESPLYAVMYSALGAHACFSGVVPLIEPAWRLSRDLLPIL